MSVRQYKWDRRYIALAEHIAAWSKDPSTRVGAVVVGPHNRVVGTGYNGFPPGVPDDTRRYMDRDYKHAHVVHAEVNALTGIANLAKGGTLYCSFPCCSRCVDAAYRVGIVRLVCLPLRAFGRSPEWFFKWNVELEKAQAAAADCGIPFDVVEV